MPPLRAESHSAGRRSISRVFLSGAQLTVGQIPLLRPSVGPGAGIERVLVMLCLWFYVCLATGGTAWSDQSPASSAMTPLVVEGDILVAMPSNRRSIALPGSVRLWSDGIVPYRIDRQLSDTSFAAIEAAVAHWNAVSGITLMSLERWPVDTPEPTDYILFQPGPGCASWVGRRGGSQEIWIAPNCTAGSVMHEIGHALGLEHEHTRPDRDQHITIHWENIDPEKRHNFDIAPTGSRMLGAYDYESIMHYGPTNFSLDGKPTITPLYGAMNALGQRSAPSRGDVAAIADLYGADLSVTTRVYSDEQLSQASIYVSNENAQGAHEIELRIAFADKSLLAYGGPGWHCLLLRTGLANCALARLAGNATSILQLDLKGPVAPEEVQASVHSKTPDGNPQNNADTSDGVSEPAAATAFEDPASNEVVSTLQVGAALWFSPVLLLLLFHRQTGCRIDRQAGHRVKGFRRRIIRRRILLQS